MRQLTRAEFDALSYRLDQLQRQQDEFQTEVPGLGDLSGSIASSILTLSGSVDGHFNQLSGTIDARFLNLTGSLISSIATLYSSVGAGSTASINQIYTTILAGTSASDAAVQTSLKSGATASLAAQYTMMLAGTSASDAAIMTSLSAGSTASLAAQYTAILAGTSASDAAVQVSLKAGSTASLAAQYTAILAGTSASDAAVQTSLKAGLTASLGSWTGFVQVTGTLSVFGRTVLRGPNTDTVTPLGGVEFVTGRNSTDEVAALGGIKDIAFNWPGAGGGYRHWLSTNHQSNPSDVGNAIKFWLNDSATAGGSSAPNTGSYLALGLYGDRTVRTSSSLIVAGSITGSGDAGFSRNVSVGAALTSSQPATIFHVDSSTTFGANLSQVALNISQQNATDNNWSIIGFSDGNPDVPSALFGVRYTNHALNYGQFSWGTRGTDGFVERLRLGPQGEFTVVGSITGSGDALFSRNVNVSSEVTAGGFTAGVLRMGSNALNNAGSALFLQYYSPALGVQFGDGATMVPTTVYGFLAITGSRDANTPPLRILSGSPGGGAVVWPGALVDVAGAETVYQQFRGKTAYGKGMLFSNDSGLDGYILYDQSGDRAITLASQGTIRQKIIGNTAWFFQGSAGILEVTGTLGVTSNINIEGTIGNAANGDLSVRRLLSVTTPAATIPAIRLNKESAITQYAIGHDYNSNNFSIYHFNGTGWDGPMMLMHPSGTTIYTNITGAQSVRVNNDVNVVGSVTGSQIRSNTDFYVQGNPLSGTINARFASLTANAGLINVQRFTANGTYTPTAGTNKIIVEMVGGGGGGGGVHAISASYAWGRGGGSGGYFKKYFSSITSATGSVIVGSGGTSGQYNIPQVGGNGGDSAFSINTVTYVAQGGYGGSGSVGSGLLNSFVRGTNPRGGTSTGDVTIQSKGTRGGFNAELRTTGGATVVSPGDGGADSLFGNGGLGVVEGPGHDIPYTNHATGYGAGGAGPSLTNAGHYSSNKCLGGSGSQGVVFVYEYA